uniref:Uncharacterized protein n=1 Tax=viral metagenome TaxID=1070528 RepID=A0A6C0ES18_9ZZZZ
MDDSEKYTPVEPNYYNYHSVNNLEKDIDYYLTINKPNNIYICSYQIVNDGLLPFLKYLLVKQYKDETLQFPCMPVFNDINTYSIVQYAENYLYNLLLLENNESFLENIVYNGSFIYDNEVYIFLNLTNCNLNINDIYRENNIWFALIDEIVNTNNVCNFAVDRRVTELFTINKEFCFLFDKNQEKYSLPIVGYVGINEKMLNFTYIFGVSAKDKNAILGPSYYFTNYQNAIKQGGWSENETPEFRHGKLLTDNDKGRYIKGGIVRFALFLNKTKIADNFQNEYLDISSTKYDRLKDNNLDVNYERLTVRISDHDGKWREEYDSVYLGKIELDNGTLVKNSPLIVIKDYNQQTPLSYHYINKKYLKDTYDENTNYVIM